MSILTRRAIMMTHGDTPQPPSDYRIVLYIESDGTQYIDTGVSGNGIADYTITVNEMGGSVTQPSNYPHFLSGDSNNSAVAPKMYYSTSGSDIGIIFQSGDGNNIFLYERDGVTHRASFIQGNCYLDDELKGVYGTRIWGNYIWRLFDRPITPTRRSKIQLYSLKMWSDGILIRDYVPVVRNSDGKAGILDLCGSVSTLTGTSFYTNPEGNNFVIGE